jgi:uncharacterized protein (DUF1015 family)
LHAVANPTAGPATGGEGPGAVCYKQGVPSFEPFPGIRYDLDRSDPATVTAPPYDVIGPEQRAALAALDPHNVVRIDLPIDGDDPYAAAGEAFAAWQADGVLITDRPSFYVYRMDTTDETGAARHTTGVFGALELSRPGEGGILPHEHTTPKAKSDRLNLLRGARANLSAVWALSPAPGLTGLLETGEDPLATWADDDGTVHSLWIVDDPDRLAKISDTIASAPVVIADGHHRFETSLAYRDERREADGGATGGPADAVLTYVVELAEEQLTVLPIHRLVSGLPEGFDLREALAGHFVVTPAGPVDPGILSSMIAQGFLVLVEPGRTSVLTPRPEAMAGLRDLDTVRLDAALAGLPEHELVFQHGIDNVTRAVERGDAQAGVLLRPATVKQITAIAHGGERMPPKTTFFHPKPRTGVVFRSLSE